MSCILIYSTTAACIVLTLFTAYPKSLFLWRCFVSINVSTFVLLLKTLSSTYCFCIIKIVVCINLLLVDRLLIVYCVVLILCCFIVLIYRFTDGVSHFIFVKGWFNEHWNDECVSPSQSQSSSLISYLPKIPIPQNQINDILLHHLKIIFSLSHSIQALLQWLNDHRHNMFHHHNFWMIIHLCFWYHFIKNVIKTKMCLSSIHCFSQTSSKRWMLIN